MFLLSYLIKSLNSFDMLLMYLLFLNNILIALNLSFLYNNFAFPNFSDIFLVMSDNILIY